MYVPFIRQTWMPQSMNLLEKQRKRYGVFQLWTFRSSLQQPTPRCQTKFSIWAWCWHVLVRLGRSKYSNLRGSVSCRIVFWFFRSRTSKLPFSGPTVGPQTSGMPFWVHLDRYRSIRSQFQLKPLILVRNRDIYANYVCWGVGPFALSLVCCQFDC